MKYLKIVLLGLILNVSCSKKTVPGSSSAPGQDNNITEDLTVMSYNIHNR